MRFRLDILQQTRNSELAVLPVEEISLAPDPDADASAPEAPAASADTNGTDAAAASDARMNGCDLPVVINSGSGNQGITASVPVVVYAQELGVSRETLYRALAVSNLSTIHIKAHIGTLSAYCGAVSAGCGAGAGITYLYGGGYEHIKHTLVNAMAITSGIICDGAKPSCAAKIATSVDAGLLGYHMYRCGNQFYAGDGIVKSGIEHTIETVGTLAHIGMADTDRQIVRLMMED